MVEVAFEKRVVEAQLANGLSKVVFTKLNGDVREMIATRDMKIIPEGVQPTGNVTTKHDSVVTVYDVENDGWRSFRLENLIEISKE